MRRRPTHLGADVTREPWFKQTSGKTIVLSCACAGFLGLFGLANAALCSALAQSRKPPSQSVAAILQLLSQQYCYADAETYSVLFHLRVHYINKTSETLILDKAIGDAFFGEMVARSVDDLANGDYEYNPNNDFFPVHRDKFAGPPKSKSPGADFAILHTGQTFEKEGTFAVVAQYDGPKRIPGLINSGTHVLRLDLSAWPHVGKASEYERAWRQSGELVTGVIDTEPLEIYVPSNPPVEKECK
jgi:hypothetical protein